MSKQALPGAGVLAVVVLLLQGCSASDASQHGRIYSKPPAYVLAALDAGQSIDENDPRVEVYSSLLSEIRSKSRNTLQEISDITIDVRQSLRDKGVSVNVYELLQSVNEAMPQHDDSNAYDYRQIALAFKSL